LRENPLVNPLSLIGSGTSTYFGAGTIFSSTMSMNKTLWELPVPATGLIRGPDFKELPGRRCEIAFSIEAEDGSEKWLAISFEGVEVFKGGSG
jgi:hypothetical protein